jgi:hypothetical protein
MVAKTLTSILTLSQDIDLNGDVDVESILDLVRGPSDLCEFSSETSRATVNVEVDDGVNVYGHVNVNDGRQCQGPGRRPPDAGAPEHGLNPLIVPFD